MNTQTHLRIIQSNARSCIRVASLIFSAAVIISGSRDQVFAGHQTETIASLGSRSEQWAPARQTSSENRKFAQLFLWPFEQNFGRPRQNFNISPPLDERDVGEARRKVIEQLRTAPPPPSLKGPLLLIVSIRKQTVTLYDAGVAVAESPISSGTPANPTPTGIFSILEKDLWHRSNIYSDAPMPYMQRLTWEGVALHEGELPGYPASHGCIRLPHDFALRLWRATNIGSRVIISYDGVAPVEFAHPRLFGPQAEVEQTVTVEPDQNVIASRFSATGLSSPSAAIQSSASIDAPPTIPPRPILARIGPPAGAPPNRVLRSGPLSILISQRDQRMYVRKDFKPLFDFPVAIANLGQPLGSHLFMATVQDEDKKTLRWTVVSMPSAPPAKSQSVASAKEAFDRLEIPKEAVDRISALISVGATIIITDQGFSRHPSGLDSDYMISTR